MTAHRPRSTNIGRLFVNTVGSSSVAHFGDNGKTALFSRAIAVQRAVPVYDHDETRFAAYELFTRPVYTLETCADVAFRSIDCSPDIRIGCVDVTALSSSSMLRAGIGGPLTAETRVKHIRQFNRLPDRDIR
ncbi:spore germination protein GerPE [Cohnella sp. GCM10027633]|uniref:spore germination protein GerPE n=1 Tax=unclassified Cohnella TaxID=2636738 RepID=UPI00363BEFC7